MPKIAALNAAGVQPVPLYSSVIETWDYSLKCCWSSAL